MTGHVWVSWARPSEGLNACGAREGEMEGGERVSEAWGVAEGGRCRRE